MDKFFSHLEGDSPMLQLIGKWGFKVYEERELVQMYLHLILSAIFPIYIGAHASLRRPPSAAEPKKSKTGENEDDDEINVESNVEGLSPSDAILFPLLAGLTLTGLYFLIKWIQDPKLLNKIMNYYFSFIGVFGVGKLATDSLNVATTYVFPSVWSSRGKTYFVDPLLSQQLVGKVKPARTQIHRQFTDKTNPFPGFLSSFTFPAFVNKKLWALRALLKNHWIFRAYIHGVVNGKSKVQMNDIVSRFPRQLSPSSRRTNLRPIVYRRPQSLRLVKIHSTSLTIPFKRLLIQYPHRSASSLALQPSLPTTLPGRLGGS
jgi:minor histocompatibility antigen H13